jgi:hypothetical protein
VKAYWWQNGVQIEPESKNQKAVLRALVRFLHFIGIKKEVFSGPVFTVEAGDEQSVVPVHELKKVLP